MNGTDLFIILLLAFIVVLLVINLLVSVFKKSKVDINDGSFDRTLRDEMQINRRESGESARLAREEISATIKSFGDSLDNRSAATAKAQTDNFEAFTRQLNDLTATMDQKMELVRSTVEKQLAAIQKDNSEKLEKIRATVDEQLQSTLEKRLGESFKLVSERLEQVHKGLGEMQNLATGVGDLKKVLTNVKTRGTWGEIQLGALLDQILTSGQYIENAQVSSSSQERVDFAIQIPSKSDDSVMVLLPIDSKFPMEDYKNIVDAQESGDLALLDAASKQLERSIKTEAKRINDKYVKPPKTTDFGIMYLPTEGLYAEVTQRTGLCQTLQQQFRVTVCGPNTIAALLSSLQMGFRTLAIEQQTSEVWRLLDAVRIEFGKFGEVLDKTQKKLREASDTIEKASTRSRVIQKKLNKVQDLQRPDSEPILELPEDSQNPPEDEPKE
jgi:DNA recombination protein RmuC